MRQFWSNQQVTEEKNKSLRSCSWRHTLPLVSSCSPVFFLLSIQSNPEEQLLTHALIVMGFFPSAQVKQLWTEPSETSSQDQSFLFLAVYMVYGGHTTEKTAHGSWGHTNEKSVHGIQGHISEQSAHGVQGHTSEKSAHGAWGHVSEECPWCIGSHQWE